jgi:hypothetical protein
MKLRFNWTSGDILHTPLAKTIKQHQSVCTDKVYYYHQNNWGMGSDLHTWTQAVCNSMQKNSTLLEQTETWIWNDRNFCGEAYHKQPLACYFNLEKHCPQSSTYPERMMSFNHSYDRCPTYIQDDKTRQEFRAAAIEYLFSNLSPKIVKAADDEIVNVFGVDGVPDNMFTVHLRWGDKKREMKLVTQQEYVDAITALAANETITHPKVFVTTESKDALNKLEAYVREHRPTWTLYNYGQSVYDGGGGHHVAGHSIHSSAASPMQMARNTNGLIGRASLIALLFAMESRYYVLTSGSNWSRLIDELRRNVIDRKCGGCTKMVDLRQAFSDHNWRV